MSLLSKSIDDAIIIKKGDYEYFIHPLTDGFVIEPDLLFDVAIEIDCLIYQKTKDKFDKILTIEAMGIPLAISIMSKPIIIARKRKYGLPGEIHCKQKTGYSENDLYINGLKPGESVVIIDDVISTGGTIRSLIKVLRENKIKIEAIVILFDKNFVCEQIRKEFNMRICSLVDVRIENNKLVML